MTMTNTTDTDFLALFWLSVGGQITRVLNEVLSNYIYLYIIPTPANIKISVRVCFLVLYKF